MRHLSICVVALATATLPAMPPAFAAEPQEVEIKFIEKPDGRMSLDLAADRIRAGAVTFIVRNQSPIKVHEFLIAKWKGAPITLPFDAKADAVDEDKLPGLQGLEDMPPGHDATVRLVL